MHFKTCIAFLEQSYYTKKKDLSFYVNSSIYLKEGHFLLVTQ